MDDQLEGGDLAEDDVRAVVNLLGRVAAASGGRVAQRRELMDGLAVLVGANCWVWGRFGAVEPGTLPVFALEQHGGFSEDRLARYVQAQEHPDLGALTAPAFAVMAERGSPVTRLRQQTDPEDRFRSSGAYEAWAAADAAPGILSLRPLDALTVGVVAIHRRIDARLFSERESLIAHVVLTGVAWLYEEGDAERDGVWVELGPRLITVMNLLLQGVARKDIAEHLRISPHTVNDYVKTVYRRFGVRSQPELMRRFFRGDGGDR